ncbi:ABC transporter substrate-binding protein [Roseibium sp. CAU 1637]|uniref:ABC transporter substrate-binding protein n=1 Tax=Roseibium limicola TaxID=2816037 RepID=A0A939EPD5_9HYPH|nr:ABC transporter substrate-binding protein [Roseibium limicola]MBO0345602.1 ABC transporter substrate-binding protein [Roseibium limicola]
MLNTFARIAVWTLALLAGGLGAAHSFELVDVAGRTVNLDKPAQTVVLGDGRALSAMAILDPENPVSRVKAMLSDLEQTDPELLAYMTKRHPETADIPMVTGVETGASAEGVIALAPDAAILSLSGHGPSVEDEEFVAQLEAAGIPVVFIDFRMNPMENTVASLELMGKVIGRDAQAEEFAEFYNGRKALIESRLAGFTGERPTVFLQAHIGRFECCVGMANGMLGPFVEAAGGRNISAEAVPGPVGRHTQEFLLAGNPDVWIGTASGTPEDYAAGKPYAVLGMHVDEKLARDSAKAGLDSAGLEVLDAVKNHRAYTIWHGFYNSPFNIYVLEVFAKWFHPELFEDLDPEATFREVHEKFLPLDRPGLYSLKVFE